MRTMFDGINTDAADIPTTARIVAGYVDGLYKWSTTDWARFPNAVKVRIAVFATTNDGHVLDCEPGNCTPSQSVDWVLLRRKAGADPTVYCGRNTWWPQIQAAFSARGVPQPHYWVADYSVSQTNPQIPTGALALQYRDTGGYDLSVVADYWPGVDPAVPAPTVPTEEDSSMVIHYITGNPEVWALSGNLYWHVVDPASLASYVKAGITGVTISDAEHQAILAAVAAQRPTVTVDASQLSAALAAVLPKSFTGTLS